MTVRGSPCRLSRIPQTGVPLWRRAVEGEGAPCRSLVGALEVRAVKVGLLQSSSLRCAGKIMVSFTSIVRVQVRHKGTVPEWGGPPPP